MAEALGHSGYLLESRIETELKRAGYNAASNSAYPDLETNKSREVDLIGIRFWKLEPASDRFDWLMTVLTIECVNNPQPLAFITKQSESSLADEEFPITGMPLMLHHESAYMHIVNLLGLRGFHHYYRGRIATQYCSFHKKRSEKEWMAYHSDDQHNIFSILTKVLDFERSQSPGKFGVGIQLTFNYLVLVIQGDLVEVQASGDDCAISDSDHIQYRRFSASETEYRTYVIDVVTETFFPQYLSQVDTELEQAKQSIMKYRTVLSEGVDEILRMKKPIPKSGL